MINWWFNDEFKNPTISGYELHQIPISGKNWISYEKDDSFKNKIVIHRSVWRFSKNFPWENIVKNNESLESTIQFIDKIL